MMNPHTLDLGRWAELADRLRLAVELDADGALCLSGLAELARLDLDEEAHDVAACLDAATLARYREGRTRSDEEALVVAANGVIYGDSTSLSAENENDRSVSLYITYGNFQYIIDGDLGGGP